MQILLKNGGKTPEFECEFNNTAIIYYASGKVEYIVHNWDVSSAFAVRACLEYHSKYKDDYKYLMEYHLYFENCKTYVRVVNVAKQRSNSVLLRVNLSQRELDILAAKTFSMFGAV